MSTSKRPESCVDVVDARMNSTVLGAGAGVEAVFAGAAHADSAKTRTVASATAVAALRARDDERCCMSLSFSITGGGSLSGTHPIGPGTVTVVAGGGGRSSGLGDGDHRGCGGCVFEDSLNGVGAANAGGPAALQP